MAFINPTETPTWWIQCIQITFQMSKLSIESIEKNLTFSRDYLMRISQLSVLCIRSS